MNCVALLQIITLLLGARCIFWVIDVEKFIEDLEPIDDLEPEPSEQTNQENGQ